MIEIFEKKKKYFKIFKLVGENLNILKGSLRNMIISFLKL